ncbi:hypothetical protein EXN66_Car019927 [Channa argus]|uniref:Uncharacterized protein n=1 Tax=Channa argus TaxID=215402 RepID=A0A6G1QPT6_CHAAH|nr:hypothetical protein EXN66_Car019927 [Channa argus]
MREGVNSVMSRKSGLMHSIFDCPLSSPLSLHLRLTSPFVFVKSVGQLLTL